MKTLLFSIVATIAISITFGMLIISGTIDIASILQIQGKPAVTQLHGLPVQPGIILSLNGSTSQSPIPRYDIKPGQSIILAIHVTPDPKNTPVRLYANPKLGFPKASGINWNLYYYQLGSPNDSFLNITIAKNVRAGEYPMEIDANMQAIPNVNFTEETYFDLEVSQNNDTVFSSLPVIHPPKCDYYPNDTICYEMTMWVDNQLRDYDESQVYDYLNRTVEMDNVTFLYTGSSTPEKDNLNCDIEFPSAINVTFGHHAPIVVFDGYYKVNETRHFAVRLADGTTNSTALCWSQFTKPKITEMCDTLCLPPIYTGMKITWLDENKTAGIVQHQYQTQDYYNAYIAEIKK